MFLIAGSSLYVSRRSNRSETRACSFVVSGRMLLRPDRCGLAGFGGYPCQTNEPAEPAGGIGGSVEWSRAEQSRETSLVHWACDFPVGGPAMAAVQL